MSRYTITRIKSQKILLSQPPLNNGNRPIYVFYYVVLLFSFLLLVARLFWLQAVNGSFYRSLSEENRIRITVLNPNRGLLKDRNGEILARNKPSFTIKIKNTVGQKEIVKKISTLVGRGNFEVLNDGSVAFFGVGRDIANKIEAVVSSNQNTVSVEADPVREYLHPYEFSHLLGYTGYNKDSMDRVGVYGVENMYEDTLRGTKGSLLFESDAFGIVLREIAKIKEFPGADINLSIDSKLQIFSYNALANSIKKTNSFGGVIVAQNPKTGEILTLLSYPSFDSNIFSGNLNAEEYNKLTNNADKPLFNRALAGLYPPGSVFKVVTSSALLEEQVVTKSTNVEAPEVIFAGGSTFRDWDSAGHGLVNLVRAIAESADTFFYKVVGGSPDFKNPLGIEKLSLWAKKFGLGQKTGFDLSVESSGLVPDPLWKKQEKGENWYLGDSYITSIGQGDLLATPLQVSQMVSVVANGGYLVKPTLSIGGGERLQEQKIISDETINIVKQGLKEACESGGTGYTFFDFPQKHRGMQVGCKTGTSEFGPKNAQGQYQTHAWFVVFAPLDDPEIILTVLLEGGGGGATDAGPVAREILDYYFK